MVQFESGKNTAVVVCKDIKRLMDAPNEKRNIPSEGLILKIGIDSFMKVCLNVISENNELDGENKRSRYYDGVAPKAVKECQRAHDTCHHTQACRNSCHLNTHLRSSWRV